MRTHSAHTRDAALSRLKRINRWLVVGSVALTGALAEVAASAFAGRTLKPSTSKSGGKSATPGQSGTTSTQPLAPPAQPPDGETPASGESARPQATPESSAPAPQASPEAPRESAPPASESTPPATSGGS
jgi:hypothetical protein